VYLHHIPGFSRLSFESIAKYSLVPYTPSVFTHQYYSPQYPQPSLPASFSTSYSDGMKFAVASQEGVAVIWDVRSSKPLKVLETDCTRGRKEGLQGRLVDTCMRKTSGIGVEADHGHRDGVFEASSSLLKVLMARKYSFSLR
jgi:hypothetical protein